MKGMAIMKKDFDLIRKILLAIEEQYIDVRLFNLEIDGYDIKTVAYHCKILFNRELISHYYGFFAENELQRFSVGSLTWDGHEFLDEIRDNTIWNKTKEVMNDKGIPFVFDAIKQITSTLINGMVEGAIKGIIK